MIKPVYILIRTSNRPKFFKVMMDSIKNQTYENIITIVHTDDPADDYVTGDIIVRSERLDKTHGSAPYNLYNNKLLQTIPEGEGYFIFIDDDDMYYDNTVIERAIKKCKRSCINVVKVQRWGNRIWPKRWGTQKYFQTECFLLHTDHKNISEWPSKKGGDHSYTKKITAQLPTNWIDGIIMCKAQEGKGRGNRYDLGESPIVAPAKEDFVKEFKVRDVPTKSSKTWYEKVDVQYLKNIKTPAALHGRAGDIKSMAKEQAQRLAAKGKVKILGLNYG